MRKVIRISLALMLVLLVVQGLGVMAGPPPGTWASGIQIQNQSTTQTAHIQIQFYWAEGTANAGQAAFASPFTAEILPGQAATYYVPSAFRTAPYALPDGFIGSAVVSSDVPVAAILNTANTSAGSEVDPVRVGAAVGVLTPSTTVYAPYLRKAYYGRNSYIAVQNTSGSSAVVYINYKAGGTGAAIPAATEIATLHPYSTKVFYQNDNANLPVSPSGFYGSAVITGTQPLAVIVNNADDNSTFQRAGFESYNGMSAGATKLWLPKLTINYAGGYQSAFVIQNAGSAAATMVVTFTFGANTYTKVSPSIVPGAAWSVYLAAQAQSGLPLGLAGAGSAVVTSNQPMIGVVPERNDNTGYSVISSGVADGSGTTVVLFPKVDRRYTGSIYNGGIQIQNEGTAATRIRATFSRPGAADVSIDSPAAVEPGKSWPVFAPNVPGLADNFAYAVVVTSLDSQPIAGIYTFRSETLKGDSGGAVNGIQK